MLTRGEASDGLCGGQEERGLLAAGPAAHVVGLLLEVEVRACRGWDQPARQMPPHDHDVGHTL